MRVIAYYLPQFHAIPENDEWWGKDFTEWVSVRNGKPLFKGHQQPVEPGELGYYNLLDADIKERQAQLAREAGVEGFCYWHYWFGGKQLLEKPLQQVMKSGKPDFRSASVGRTRVGKRRLGWTNRPLRTVCSSSRPIRPKMTRRISRPSCLCCATNGIYRWMVNRC